MVDQVTNSVCQESYLDLGSVPFISTTLISFVTGLCTGFMCVTYLNSTKWLQI